MSATLPLPEEVGLEDPVMIDVPMSFPAANRPIIMEPCGKMSLAHRAETTVVAAEVIRMLAKGRSIIHAHSYGVASSLSKELHRLGVPHVLQDGGDREGSLNGWIEGDVPIYVSVNMGEGISLDDDKCRTNFILKMPFPFLGDPWVQARNRHLGNDWAMPAVARAICQALGRSTRSESDWSSAYVLDSDFLWFYRAWSHAFPPWFREAVGLPPATGPAAAKEAV
jgi:Rad3-related DNA helicase